MDHNEYDAADHGFSTNTTEKTTLEEVCLNSSLARDFAASNMTWCRVQGDVLPVETLLSIFQVYVTPLVLIVGIVGSLVASAVLICGELRAVPCSVYLSAVAISDTCFLLSVLITWLKVVRVNVYDLPMSCEFLTMISNATNFLCTWYLVCLVIDRYIVVCWPRFRSTCCTTFRAKIVVVAIAVGAVVIHVNTTIMFGVLKTADAIHCAPLPRFHHTMRLLEKFDVFSNTVVPFVAVIALLCCIVRQMFLTKGRRPSFRRSDRRRLPDPTKRLLRSWSRKAELRLTKSVAVYLSAVLILRLPGPAFRLATMIKAIEEHGYQLPFGDFILHEMFQCLFYLSFAIKPFILLATWLEFRKSFAHGLAAFWPAAPCKEEQLRTIECGMNGNRRSSSVRKFSSAEALKDLSLV